MERELLLAGIGGQGVQLAAQLLAKAATRTGRHAQLFGSYGGMMRGGNTDATLILGDAPVQSPPMVGSAWSAIVMHNQFARSTLGRLRSGGLLVVNTSVVNTSVVTPPTLDPSIQVLALAASELANELGAAAAASMVALGAYVAATTVVSLDALIDTLPEALPSYRRQHVESSARALRAGHGVGVDAGIAAPAWPIGAAA